MAEVAALAKSMRSDGATIREIALRLGKSKRTINRYLRGERIS